MHWKLLIFIILFSPLCIGQDITKRLSPWWDARWNYRQVFIVEDPELADKINTASLTIDTLGRCLPGGKDIRVVDGQSNIVPYCIVAEYKGLVNLDIELKTTEPKNYFVYYGNPQAEEVKYRWEKKLGGLYLEVRELNLNAGVNMYPNNLSEVQQLIRASTKSFGKKLWGKIDDAANPFAPQQDFYISIYTGNLFCPETGEYKFATNSDDASFLLVNGEEVASWPGGHVQSVDWVGEEEGRRSQTISLQRGIYKIEYYHVEDQGGQLARAGWKRPSDKFFSTIGSEFFIRKLKARVIGYQEHKKPLNAYFTFRGGKSIQVSDAGQHDAPSAIMTPVFRTMFFEDCSLACLGKVALWHWDFGDGNFSNERNPMHDYRVGGKYYVSLLVKDNLGFSSRVRREVEVKRYEEGQETVKVKIFFEVKPKQNILNSDEPLHLELKVRSSTPDGVKLSLISELRDSNGIDIERSVSNLIIQDKLYSISKTYNFGSYCEYTSRESLSFTLTYNDVPVARRTVVIVPASEPPPRLRVKNASLTTVQSVSLRQPSFSDRRARISSSSSYGTNNGRGNIIVLRISNPKSRRLSSRRLVLPNFKIDLTSSVGGQGTPPYAPNQTSTRGGRSLKIIFLDDSCHERDDAEVSGSVVGERQRRGKVYRDFLQEMLAEHYPDATITIKCVGISQEDSSFPRLARISSISSRIIPAKPDLVIIPCSTDDILYHLPIDDYKKFLAAAIEMIVGQCGAEVLLVTPAPLISDTGLSYDYALAIKEVAQERGIPVADVYSAFYNMGKEWKTLYQDETRTPGKGNPIFYLHPNSRGQRKIATEIFDEIIR